MFEKLLDKQDYEALIALFSEAGASPDYEKMIDQARQVKKVIEEDDSDLDKVPLLLELDMQDKDRSIPEFITRKFFRDELFTKFFSWAIPQNSIVNTIKKYNVPIIYPGAGTALIAKLLNDRDIDVIASDNFSWGKPVTTWFETKHADSAEHVLENPDRSVLLSWPPYNDPMAYDVANAMGSGSILFYIGEMGGCTAEENFNKLTDQQFTPIETIPLVSWEAIHDNLYIFRKN